MRAVRQTAAVLLAASLLVVLFFTAFQIGIFNLRYIDREMEKLNTAERIGMEPEELHTLFDETLKYLADDRDDLVIDTRVNGELREAYNDREKLHMVDVKALFIGGFRIRNAAAVTAVLMAIGMIVFRERRQPAARRLLKELSRAVVVVWGVFLLLFAVLILLLITDFNTYFTIFHQLFFTNDYWLLDPATSLMINMVPEQFFYDMVIRIGVLFAVPFILLLAGGTVCWYRLREKRTV